jgi:hypothetical protein
MTFGCSSSSKAQALRKGKTIRIITFSPLFHAASLGAAVTGGVPWQQVFNLREAPLREQQQQVKPLDGHFHYNNLS